MASNTNSTVKVAAFRNVIEHLETLVHVDFHTCVSPAERAAWVERAQRVGRELLALSCPRATAADLTRRKVALERSANRIASITHTTSATFKAGDLTAEFHDASKCTFDGRTWYVASICKGVHILDTHEAGTPAEVEAWVYAQLRERTGLATPHVRCTGRA